MPRKAEIQAEEAAVGSPLRRSTRKASTNSPAAAPTVKTRHSSLPPETIKGNEKIENKSAARGKRGSSVTKETGVSTEIEEKPQLFRRTRRSSLDVAASTPSTDSPRKLRGRRSSIQDEKIEEPAKKSLQKPKTEIESEGQNEKKSTKVASSSKDEPEEKPENVKVRSRRSSVGSEASQETNNPPVDTPRTLRTRRNSTQEDKTEESSEKKIMKGRRKSIESDNTTVSTPKERKVGRGRRSSIDALEDSEDKPNKSVAAKPRRRLSITENAVSLEPITEQETESRKSTSPIVDKSLIVNVTNVATDELLKTDVNLSIINESVSEDVEESLNKTSTSPGKNTDQDLNNKPEDNLPNTSPQSTSKATEQDVVHTENNDISVDSKENQVSVEVSSNEEPNKDEKECTQKELEENESIDVDTPSKDNENVDLTTTETSAGRNSNVTVPVVTVETAETILHEHQNQPSDSKSKLGGEDSDLENLSPVRKSPKLSRTIEKGSNSPIKLDFNETVEHSIGSDLTNTLSTKDEISKTQDEEDSVFLDGSEQLSKNMELKKSVATISSGSDGSFNVKLDSSILKSSSQSSQEEIGDDEATTPSQSSQTEIESELNSSKASNSSDKENIPLTTDLNSKSQNEKEVLKSIVDVLPQKAAEITVARVSNVFRPKNVDYSFVEPMDVDMEKTVLSTTAKIDDLDADVDSPKKLSDKSIDNTTVDDSFKLSLSINQTHQEEVNTEDNNAEVIESKNREAISNKKVLLEGQGTEEKNTKKALDQVEGELLADVEDTEKTLHTPNTNEAISNPSSSEASSCITKQNESVSSQEEVKSNISEDYEFQVPSDEELAQDDTNKEIPDSTELALDQASKEVPNSTELTEDDANKEKPNSTELTEDDANKEIPNSTELALDQASKEVPNGTELTEDDANREKPNSTELTEDDANKEISNSTELALDDSNKEIPNTTELVQDKASKEMSDTTELAQDDANKETPNTTELVQDDANMEIPNNAELTQDDANKEMPITTEREAGPIAQSKATFNDIPENAAKSSTSSKESDSPLKNQETLESQEKIDENKSSSQDCEAMETSVKNITPQKNVIGKKSEDEEDIVEADIGKKSADESVDIVDVEDNTGNISESIENVSNIEESENQSGAEDETSNNEGYKVIDKSLEISSEPESKKMDNVKVQSTEEAEEESFNEISNVNDSKINESLSEKQEEGAEIIKIDSDTDVLDSKKDISDLKEETTRKSISNEDVEDSIQITDTSTKEIDSLEQNESKEATKGKRKKKKKLLQDTEAKHAKIIKKSKKLKNNKDSKSETEVEQVEDLEQFEESKSQKRKSKKIKHIESLDTSITENEEIEEKKSLKSKKKENQLLENTDEIEVQDEDHLNTSIQKVKSPKSKSKKKRRRQSLAREDEESDSLNVTDETKLKKSPKLISIDLDAEETNTVQSKTKKDKDDKQKAGTINFKGIDTEELDKYLSLKLSQMDRESDNEGEESENEDKELGSGSEGSTGFIDDMAEEGEEDTPSEDSNQIIDEGESINTTDSEPETEDDYDENDSFICDEENVELLPGEEYDLDDSSPKRKKSRIINIENIDTDVIKIQKKEKAPPTPRRKSRIIHVSSSSDEEEIPQEIVSTDENSVSENVVDKEKTTEVVPSVDTMPKFRDSTTKSSIVIQENIKVSEIQDATLSKRINRIVDSFCTTVSTGELAMNLSLEYSKDSEPIASTAAKPRKKKRKQKKMESNKSPKKRKLSISLHSIETSTDDEKQRRKRKSQSLDSLSSLEVPKKKKKKNKKHEQNLVKEIHSKKLKKSAEDLQRETLSIMNRLITDVKNRPARKIKPSNPNSELSTSWIVEDAVDIKPSTSIATTAEKKRFHAGKIHPKDFKSQMLYDSKHVNRIETKKLLAKKGASIPF